MISNNPAVLDGGEFGTIIEGNGITIDGGPVGVALTGPVTIDGGAVFAGGTVGNTTIAGNLVISGASRLLQGDWSNATQNNRVKLQTSTTNGSTNIEVVPNGTSAAAGVLVENNSTIGNNSYGILVIGSTRVALACGVRGTGTAIPLYLAAGTGVNVSLGIDINGNVTAGGSFSAALATNATNGFLFINSCAGVPTGVPAGFVGATGKTPVTVNTTNSNMYFYSGSAWRNTNTPDYELAVATALQTVFSTTMRTVAASGGKAFIQVFVNGVKQVEGGSYSFTVTGTNEVTFNVGVTLNAVVEFYGFA